MNTHDGFMRVCFDLARKGLGSVSPNPLVGAVLVKNNRIISTGYHKKFAGPHAEVDCLNNCEGDPRGATMYVNLEPCCYHGKTPPCTELLIRTGIQRLVVAMKDPNPLVAGKGLRSLKQAGIRVENGVLESEAVDLNRWFIVNMKRRRPYVHLKVAQSLDGRITSGRNRAERISSKESHALVHQWRSTHDAILVGAGTILADNPRLNVRYARGRTPAVIILDGRLSLHENSQVLKSISSRRVIVCTGEAGTKRIVEKIERLRSQGVEVMTFKRKRDEMLDLHQVMGRLFEEGIGSVMVEGGARTFAGFSGSSLVDQLSVFVAPKLFNSGVVAFQESGKLRNRLKAARITSQSIGPDILVQAFFT